MSHECGLAIPNHEYHSMNARAIFLIFANELCLNHEGVMKRT